MAVKRDTGFGGGGLLFDQASWDFVIFWIKNCWWGVQPFNPPVSLPLGVGTCPPIGDVDLILSACTSDAKMLPPFLLFILS